MAESRKGPWQPPAHGAILGICGFKNTGKTTLIEGLIPRLKTMGLEVVVIKHDSHGIDVDRPGKDSDRFFRAGADVLLQGHEEEMFRRHREDPADLETRLARLVREYDLVLVEGHKGSPVPKVWLDGGSAPAPANLEALLKVLPPGEGRLDAVAALIEDRLKAHQSTVPVFGLLLIGGQSRRMGRPKHLIESGGMTWAERAAKSLEEYAKAVLISGKGDVPGRLDHLERLTDPPGIEGPMAGILSAMRWLPDVSWLVAACDMPAISDQAVTWLLSKRRPGAWAIMPALPGLEPEIQPLLAFYDFRAKSLLEGAVRSGDFSLFRLSAHEKVITPKPPQNIRAAWKNINTLEDLQRHRDQYD